jgi:cobalt-zinc-cadmium efflux system outer membrane protein
MREARKEKINREVTLRVQPCLRTIKPLEELDNYHLTRDQAMGIALRENPILNAAWAHLGVAHADLEEAGLYTNPTLAGVFGPLINHNFINSSSNIYITLVGKLSDVWIVPIKEKIAEDELAIASWQTTTQILETIKSTHIAYDTCVFAQQQLNSTEQLIEVIRNNKPEDEKSSDYASYNSAYQKIKIELIKKQSAYQEARIHLASALGLDPSIPFKLVDSLPPSDPTSFDTAELINYAYLHQPYLIIARLKKHQALYKLKECGRKIFENVEIGFDYQQDSARDRGFGPIIQTDIPIFNTQHASTERARAYITECEHAIVAAERKLQENISLLTLQIQAIDAEIALRTLQQPLTSSENHQNISSKERITTTINDYESFLTMSNLLMNRARLSAELDYVIGARWQNVISPLPLKKDTL